MTEVEERAEADPDGESDEETTVQHPLLRMTAAPCYGWNTGPLNAYAHPSGAGSRP